MTTVNNLTIAIITYKRPDKLQRCLESFLKFNKIFPNEIVIIDNDPNKSAEQIFQKYQQKLPLKYLNVIKKGAPVCRNKALEICRTKYLSFIDDDCIFGKDWIVNVKKALSKNPQTYIIGKTLLLNRKNNLAKLQYENHTEWLKHKIRNKNQLPPEALDTKNIIFNLQTIKLNKLQFDPCFTTNKGISGFEDIDFGYSLAQHNLYGTYYPNIIAYHEETSSLKSMLTKSYYRGVLKNIFVRKWNTTDGWTPDFDLKIYRNYIKYIPGIWHFIYKTGKLFVHTVLTKKSVRIFLLNCLNSVAFSQGYLDYDYFKKNKRSINFF